MLQIFVPVATALLVAAVAYRFGVRTDREARFAEARLQIQRQAIENAQQALADYWFWGQKVFRTRSISDPDVVTGLERASTQLSVTYSRLQDRQLADGIIVWHKHITVRMGSVIESQPSYDEAKLIIHSEDIHFLGLCNTLGNSLRDLSSTSGRARTPRPWSSLRLSSRVRKAQAQGPVQPIVGETPP